MREAAPPRTVNEISIRAATDADLVFILEILNAEIAASSFVYAEAPLSLDDRRDWLRAHETAGLPIVVATEAEHSEVRLGWAALSVYRPSGGYRFTVEASVYVSPNAQRRGVGAKLLDRLCDEALARGKHVIVASIDADNAPSVALFERFGFCEVGRLPEVGHKFGEWRTQLLFHRVVARG